MNALPLLKYIKHIEYFDGPLLTEKEGPDGTKYLSKWHNLHSEDGVQYHQWLLFQVSAEDLAAYIGLRISLRNLILKAPEAWLADWDHASKSYIHVNPITPAAIPEDDLPAPEAMHDPDLIAD